MSEALPVISVRENTFPAAVKVREVKAPILSDDEEKMNVAIDAFEQAVPTEQFIRELLRRRPGILTPRMFEHRLVEWARRDPKHIVLPEGEDERILRAAGLAPRKGIARLTLLGDPETIAKKGRPLGLDLSRVEVVDPARFPKFERYAERYYQLRRHKGITYEMALDLMAHRNCLGAMMVLEGDADGMVSGAVHTTADTLRPAFEIIKTRPGYGIVSSVFFMCLKDRVLVYGDCAVNPDPMLSS